MGKATAVALVSNPPPIDDTFTERERWKKCRPLCPLRSMALANHVTASIGERNCGKFSFSKRKENFSLEWLHFLVLLEDTHLHSNELRMKVEEINFGVPLDVVGRPPSRHVAQTKKTWEILCEIFPKIFLRCVNVRQGSKNLSSSLTLH